MNPIITENRITEKNGKAIESVSTVCHNYLNIKTKLSRIKNGKSNNGNGQFPFIAACYKYLEIPENLNNGKTENNVPLKGDKRNFRYSLIPRLGRGFVTDVFGANILGGTE